MSDYKFRRWMLMTLMELEDRCRWCAPHSNRLDAAVFKMAAVFRHARNNMLWP